MQSWIIETSTERGLIAFLENGHIVFTKELPVGYNQSKTLMSELHQANQQLNVAPAELSCIGVGVGPGSYTGIRIGVAVAKALAYAWQLPIIKFCTLEAFVPEEDTPFAALIDAKIGGAYVLKGESKGKEIHYSIKPMVCPLDQLELLLKDVPLLITPYAKHIKARVDQLYPHAGWHWREMSPSARRIGHLIKERYEKREWSVNGQLELLYLRKTEAEREKELKRE